MSREGRWIRTTAIVQVNAFSSLKSRMVDAFANITQEVEDAAQARFDELMGQFSDGSDDPADAADDANEAGIALWQSLADMKQSMLNLTAAGLYHLFEQQASTLVRESGGNGEGVSGLQVWLQTRNIDSAGAPNWAILCDELRHVANAVKHAEGSSTKYLRKHRPDLFQPAAIRSLLLSLQPSARPVSTPLAGDDLYIDEATLDIYVNSVIGFWNWLQGRFESLPRRLDPSLPVGAAGALPRG